MMAGIKGSPVKWGVVSTGRIVSDFLTAMRTLPTLEHQVQAVSSRTQESAESFAKKWKIPRSYGSNIAMAQDKDIDVVYVAPIHPQHFEVCKIYLSAGKNVLCEKPLTMNAKEAKQLVSIARQKKVFFMEAFWSRFFPIYYDLRSELAANNIGEVRIVTINVGFNVMGTGNIPRLEDKALGGGLLLDTGCYPIQFVQMVFNHEKPQRIVTTGFVNEKGVDESFSATFTYSNNRMAVITCTFRCNLDPVAQIFGTNGQIEIPNFAWPDKMITPTEVKSHPAPEKVGPLNFGASMGLIYEIQEVGKCLSKGLTEHPLMTLDMSIQLMEIMDEMRKQLGLAYDADKAK